MDVQCVRVCVSQREYVQCVCVCVVCVRFYYLFIEHRLNENMYSVCVCVFRDCVCGVCVSVRVSVRDTRSVFNFSVLQLSLPPGDS